MHAGVTKAVNAHVNIIGELTEEDIKKFWGIDVTINNNKITLQTTKTENQVNTERKMTLPQQVATSSRSNTTKAPQSPTLSDSSLSGEENAAGSEDEDDTDFGLTQMKGELIKNQQKVHQPHAPTPPPKSRKRSMAPKGYKTELGKLRDMSSSVNKLLIKLERKATVVLDKAELCEANQEDNYEPSKKGAKFQKQISD